MAPLRSKQFYSGVISSSAWQNVYTAPPGHVFVLKSVVAQNSNATTETLDVRIDGTTVMYYPLAAYPGAAAFINIPLWVVSAAGGTLDIASNNGHAIAVHLSGSVLYV